MKIGILGTGMVGQALASRLAELGHDVTLGSRDPDAARSRPAAPQGGDLFAEWLQRNPAVRLAGYAEAAEAAEIVVNATQGAGSIAALEQTGRDRLRGKIVVDVANPLDFSRGFPPTLFVKDEDSLAERIQRAFPEARVVKALNTMNAAVMVDPRGLAGGDHTVFVCGDDEAAKARVADLLRGMGWRDVLDVGPLETARGTEMLLPVWLRLLQRLGTARFNFKIVR